MPGPFDPVLTPSAPTITGSGSMTSVPTKRSTVPALLPQVAMMKRYQATPAGYVITGRSTSADPNPGVTAPAGGDFSSFPPGCGSGGTCDWDVYNAQQAAAHAAPGGSTASGMTNYATVGKAMGAPGALPPPASGGGAAASGTTTDASGVTKTLVPIAQVQCALAAMGDAPGLPPISVNGVFDSVTQRWVDAYMTGHHAGETYAVVGGSIQFMPTTAAEFSGGQCAGLAAGVAKSSNAWKWWAAGLALLAVGGGMIWYARR